MDRASWMGVNRQGCAAARLQGRKRTSLYPTPTRITRTSPRHPGSAARTTRVRSDAPCAL